MPPKRLALYSTGQRKPDIDECGQARKWNGASLRVLQKLAFVDTGQDVLDAEYGDSVVTTRTLPGQAR